MITRMDAINSNGKVLSLNILDQSNGYAVREITGLDPVKADVNDLGTDSSLGVRNIVISLDLLPQGENLGIEDLRRGLYPYFMSQSKITLRFFDNGSSVDISGIVESMETPIFASSGEVQISIICPDTEFVATEALPLPPSQSSNTVSYTNIEYPGTVSSGLVLTATIAGAPTGIGFMVQTEGLITQAMAIQYSFSAGDILSISTIKGAKYVRVLRNGSEYSILGYVNPTSAWPLLYHGINQTALLISGSETHFNYSITVFPQYGGL